MFYGRRLDTFSKIDIEYYRREMASNGYSIPTINKGHMILKRYFNKFKEFKEGIWVNGMNFEHLKLPKVNPASLVPIPGERIHARVQTVTVNSLNRLRYVCDNDLNDPELRDLINVLIWTDLRLGDILKITESNISFERNYFYGVQSKTVTSKNPSGVPYYKPLTKSLRDIFKNRIKVVKPGTRLFPMKNIQRRFAKLKRIANLEHIHIGRDLRRTGATYLLDTGSDEIKVANWLGHTTTRNVPIYGIRTDKHMADIAKTLENKF